jgi:hypothetical protein
MRRLDESDLDYWARRRSEALALADKADGELREAHFALAESYARLIELTTVRTVEPADARPADPR